MTAQEQIKEFEKIIKPHDLTLSAVYVPFSKSRNAESAYPSMNWKVSIKTGLKLVIETDYMQGIGHMPNYVQSWGSESGHRKTYEKKVAESGRYLKVLPKFSNGRIDWWKAANGGREIAGPADRFYNDNFTKPLPMPELIDVLYALITDCDVLNYESFGDWADCFGYNADSIKEKQIYDDCLNIALKIRANLGQDLMSELAEFYQDY